MRRAARGLVICTNAPGRLGAMQIRDKDGGRGQIKGFEVGLFFLEIGGSEVNPLLLLFSLIR